MNRQESMRRHPSYVSHLIAEAQDRQAMDLANRERVDLEEWGMSPLRRVDEAHHDATTAGAWWVHVVGPAGIALVIFMVIFGTAVLGELVGGWPT